MDAEALPQRSHSGRRNRSHDSRPAKVAKNGDQTSAGKLAVEAQPEHSNGAEQDSRYEWGATLQEALANTGLAMYNYMTPLSGIAINPSVDRTFAAEGHDMQSLVFNFLDELLFIFSTEFFTCKELTVTELDRQNWKVKAQGRGDIFDRQKHEPGTEVKAITYSAMQINEHNDKAELYVIVDI